MFVYSYSTVQDFRSSANLWVTLTLLHNDGPFEDCFSFRVQKVIHSAGEINYLCFAVYIYVVCGVTTVQADFEGLRGSCRTSCITTLHVSCRWCPIYLPLPPDSPSLGGKIWKLWTKGQTRDFIAHHGCVARGRRSFWLLVSIQRHDLFWSQEAWERTLQIIGSRWKTRPS